MAQQTLQTIVTIGGNVDNSFGTIGSALIGLGSQIDMISQKVIDFGKESIEKYVNYDDLMREVKALGGYSDAQMQAFDAYNKQIAQSSRHSMEAAASAEGLIAQLGLNIEQTKALLPSVLDLSVAAKTDTAQALDYLYYTLNAFDLELTDAEVLADQMSKTAAIGATEIDTLGRSFQRMGSSLRLFGGGSSEVLAILNGIGQFGDDMQGTKAGTQLRNFMLSLIAPVGKKGELLDSLEYAGVTIEEYEDYIQEAGINTEEAAATMEKLGFSAYDSAGKIKPAIQIIDELNRSLATYGDQERDEILSTLFGKRTYVTASNLLSITKEEYEAWQREILYNSDGFTKDMADTMDGGLGGALRKLESAWGAMQITIADHLAPAVESVAAPLKDISIAVANTDPKILDAIVSGLGTIAVAGPALMTAGLAFRLIGYALTPAGGIGLGLIALASAANAMEKLQEADMAGKFGTMSLDAEALGDFVVKLGNNFRESYEYVGKFSGAVDKAVESYQKASTEFSSKLMTAMLTGSTLSQTDIEALNNLGNEIHKQVLSGIENRANQSANFWEALFGGIGKAEKNGEYREIIDLTNQDYLDTVAKLEAMSQGLRDAMSDAFEDGTISPEEREKIMSYLRNYNEMVAQVKADAAREESQIALEKQLMKSQTVSLDDLQRHTKELADQRDAQIEELEDMYLDEKARVKVKFDRAIAEGRMLDGRKATKEGKRSALENADMLYKKEVEQYNHQYNQAALLALESAIKDSELSGAWKALEKQAGRYLSGQIGQKEAENAYRDIAGSQGWQLERYLLDTINTLGGYDAVIRQMNENMQSNPAWAMQMAKIIAMSGISTGETYLGHDREALNYIYQGYDPLAETYQTFDEIMKPAIQNYLPEEAYSIQATVEPQIGPEAVQEAAGEQTITADIVPSGQGEAAQGAADEAQSVLDNNGLSMEVALPNGGSEAASFYGSAQAFLSANPGSWTINVVQNGGLTAGGKYEMPGMAKYAGGGRADEASIFGEDGPEWAIPEEHSERTADLLDEARRASGFTWPELIARTGGLNAGTGGNAVHVVYAPVIHAADARGVEQKLREDKERFNAWFNERQLLDEAEVY